MIQMKKILAVILLVSFLFRLALALQPVDLLMQKIILDDSLYGLETAKNMAAGFISHNGYDATNGVQPLWPLMVSQFFNFGDGIFLALLTSAILDTLSTFLIYKISRKFFSKKISMGAAVLYGLNPITVFTAMSGIDVVLAIFMVALIFQVFLYKKSPWILGTTLGLGLLARADILFLAVPIVAAIFLENRKRAVSVGAVTLLIFLPWLVWSFVNFGTIQQSSGIANYLHAHEFLEEPQPLYSLAELLIHGGKNFIKFSAFAFHYFGAVDYSAASFAIGGVSVFLAAVGFFQSRKILFIPLIYGVLIAAFYSFYLWSFGPRYIAPLAVFICIAISSSINWLAEKIKFKNLFSASIIILILIFSLAGLQVWQRGYFPWQAATLDEVKWIKENTNVSDTIGSFNSGIMTYFSRNKIANLDGIMNFKAIEAIQNRNIYSYMKSEEIKYWVDMDFFPAEAYDNQDSFDITKENRWRYVLGEGSENLKLIEQNFYRFENLRGNNVTIVRFAFEVV